VLETIQGRAAVTVECENRKPYQSLRMVAFSVTFSELRKYLVTRSIARLLCDS